MAVGDVWQLTVVGEYLGQTVNNVYYYQQTLGDIEPTQLAGDVADAFVDKFLTTGSDVGYNATTLSSLASYSRVYTINLFDPVKFTDKLLSPVVAGTAGGVEVMPPYVCYQFTSQRTRRDVRAGRKRIVGVPEAYGAGGDISSTYKASMATEFTALLGQELSLGGTNTGVDCVPVVVQRIKEVTEDGVTYRLPENLGEAVTMPATSWVLNPYLSTQNTRKRGRGI